ncbi:4-(cytidine 5'-diphospho)-2-C-methyl-D-erythritol kinase [Verticiella sediminum]|uniref:4-diphosphocytidyl-2-C-methyl-D-erythritol kinase n=1 Tax=Verticiella sediminum TaxID=1247510 RepID=A0A556B1I9_9BURK|nr:4-(cytidine 5'-diphospho)-2-C-methyl-D-erythritol kinase [Verticiella sediminum]TSH99014.1 4-(cytidine 5'-diphospho)-2-C-methyl-D-erythritol kinase [Verticiella sediminum]
MSQSTPPAAADALPPPILRDVPAPAKINLFLHVVGRRADGYHLLQTVFRFVGLADTLHFRRRDDGVIRRVTPIPGVPEATCLTVNAALALRRATGCRLGVDIEVEKRIPAGGGLGGGSSDAASVLLALNRLWGTGLGRAELQRIALPLGADVPVFVFGQNAFAEGVGEALRAVRLAPQWYVVIQPNAHVPTEAAFRAQELTRDTNPVKISDFPGSVARHSSAAGEEKVQDNVVGPRASDGAATQALGLPEYSFLGSFGKNDLEPVVFSRFPMVALARLVATQALRRSGGDTRSTVRMSGSGACLFVECASEAQALALEAEIAATMRQSNSAKDAIRAVTVCQGLDGHPLQHWAA